MGLDGLSLNNLGLKLENTSKENSIQNEITANLKSIHSKGVDQLEKKQAIDTQDKENPSYAGGFSDGAQEDEQTEDKAENEQEYDLADSEKFEVKQDSDSKSILIINKEENSIVQKITPEELSCLVGNLKQASGVLINKRI